MRQFKLNAQNDEIIKHLKQKIVEIQHVKCFLNRQQIKETRQFKKIIKMKDEEFQNLNAVLKRQIDDLEDSILTEP